MASGWSIWNDDQLAFMQDGINAMLTYQEVAERTVEKFGVKITKNSIVALVFRGKLKAPANKKCRPKKTISLARTGEISRLCDEGWTVGQISRKTGFSDHTIRKHLLLAKKTPKSGRPRIITADVKRQRAPEVVCRDDPIADVGFSLIDLRANGCHFPIARWPTKYPIQRFCGQQRMMNGQYFASAYCIYHHSIAHKPMPAREAAE